jgi:hypothetical protein
MKLIHVIILSVLFVGTSITTEAKLRKVSCHHVSVLSVKRDVFYFKVDTEFQGATAEVFDTNGKLCYSITLHKKRELIDFFYLEAGEYTIRFSRGNQSEEHQYSVVKRS